MNEQVTDISQALKRLTSECSRCMKPSMRYIRRMRICAVTWKGFEREPQPAQAAGKSMRSPTRIQTTVALLPPKKKMKAEVIRRTKSLRKKSGLKPGGQPGHEAHNRNMTEKPNVVEDCMSGYCRECGRDLSDIAGELDYVSQVVDLPTLAPVRERISPLQEDLHLLMLQ